MHWLTWLGYLLVAIFVGIPTYCVLGQILRLTLIDLLIRISSMLFYWKLVEWNNGFRCAVVDKGYWDDFWTFQVFWPFGLLLCCVIPTILFLYRLIWLFWQALKTGWKIWWTIVSEATLRK